MSPASNHWKKMRDKWGENHIFTVTFRKKILLLLSLLLNELQLAAFITSVCLPPKAGATLLRPGEAAKNQEYFYTAGHRSLAPVKIEPWFVRLTEPLCVSRCSDIPGVFILILIEDFFFSSLICPPDNWGVTIYLCALFVHTFVILCPLSPLKKKKDLIIDYTLSGTHDYQLLTDWDMLHHGLFGFLSGMKQQKIDSDSSSWIIIHVRKGWWLPADIFK